MKNRDAFHRNSPTALIACIAQEAALCRWPGLIADPSGMTSDEFNQFVLSYGSRMAQLIREAGIKPPDLGC